MRRFLSTCLLMALVLLAFVRPVGAEGDFPAFWQDKEKYVALRDLAVLYKMDLSGPSVQRFTLQNRWNNLVFKADSRELTVNGTVIWLHEPMTLVRGRWALREGDVTRERFARSWPAGTATSSSTDCNSICDATTTRSLATRPPVPLPMAINSRRSRLRTCRMERLSVRQPLTNYIFLPAVFSLAAIPT